MIRLDSLVVVVVVVCFFLPFLLGGVPGGTVVDFLHTYIRFIQAGSLSRVIWCLIFGRSFPAAV